MRPARESSTVYPRWRGEHDVKLTSQIIVNGLSPLARGTLFDISQNTMSSRSIPAGAGNTEHGVACNVAIAVYPRWRGEHVRGQIDKERWNGLSPLAGEHEEARRAGGPLVGLSPLARGTPGFSVVNCLKHRSIPAGAGNTALYHAVWLLCSVYPRWRGEHYALSACDKVAAGLSPLARGTPSAASKGECRFRSIPAGAGNTAIAPRNIVNVSVYPRWRGEHYHR